MKLIVRTSDRIAFKRCRRSWDLGSIVRQNYVPDRAAKPLEFGTAWHEAMATYYEPSTWDLLKKKSTREVVHAAAIASYEQTAKEQLEKRRNPETSEINQEDKDDFKERLDLALGMLRNYFEWAPENDHFTPRLIEVDFEVPILDPDGNHLEMQPLGSKKLLPVYYQGRLDGIVEDKFGWYWVLEHKTTGQMSDDSHLVLDEQTGSYAWAVQHMLGIRVQGVVYSEALKDAPKPPLRLKSARQGRHYSVNKQARTTYHLYLKTIAEAGEDVSAYEEHLEYLKLKGNPFFRRNQVHRNQNELADIGHRIYLEAQDMFDDKLRIYPNPSRFNCMMCAFKQVCISMNDGSDYQFLLDTEYRNRNQEEIDARRARV